MRSIRILFMLLVCSIVCSANASVTMSENGVQTTLSSNPKKPAQKKKSTSKKKPAKKKPAKKSNYGKCGCDGCGNGHCKNMGELDSSPGGYEDYRCNECSWHDCDCQCGRH